MQKKINKEDKEFAFFRDFWTFYENYYIPETNELYWDSLNKEANTLLFKYSDITISRKLILQVIVELEERLKKYKTV